jgi:excisionase family DNA binding protein
MDRTIAEDSLELLDAKDVGRMLKRSSATVLTLWQTGELGGFRLGHRGVRFRRSDVLAYIDRHRVDPR